MAAAPVFAQFYQGTMTANTSHTVTMINMRLTFNGNAISGGIGIGSVQGGAQIVGQLQPNIPVQGTRTGSTCTVRIVGSGGGLVLTGPCTPTSFSGAFTVGAQSGRFSVSASAPSTVPAPVYAPAQPAAAPYRPAPVAPPSAPPTPAAAPYRPLPAPAPVAPANSTQLATRYCGTDRNTTFNVSWNLVVTIDPGAAFTGNILSGNEISGTAVSTKVGDGGFTGTRTGTTCQGTTQAGEVFTGSCTPTAFNATYTALGQHGTLNATTQACGPVTPAAAPIPTVASAPAYAPAPAAKTSTPAVTPPARPAPAPIAAVAPVPAYAPAPAAAKTPPAVTPPARPATQPVAPAAAVAQPAPAQTITRYCGTDRNTTFNVSWNLVVTIDPGSAFTGSILSGDEVSGTNVSTKVGDGGFTGTRTGTTCQGTTQAGEVFTGSCTPTAFNATYTALGQHGTLNATTQACGAQK